MSGVLDKLSPSNVFEYFEEICSIPRQTGDMTAITEYITSFASDHMLAYKTDAAGNIVVSKDASYGYEDREPVVIQAHLDMVCEKNYDLDYKHDFKKDPLNLITMDEYVYAKGTSLGAKDGIVIAYILAVLSDDSLDHPAIEAVFTIDCKDGMKGALGFDESLITGRRLISLDHDTEGEILTSSAGVRKVKSTFEVKIENYTGVKYSLVISGLVGGHSGMEIDKGRGNANLLMGRFVHYIAKRVPIKIGYLKGGLADTAIPREAKAEIYVEEQYVDTVDNLISEFVDIIAKEYGDVEENLTMYGENLGVETSIVLDDVSQRKVGLLVNTIPDGIIKMSRNGDDLVQTSLNCGMMRLYRDHFDLIISLRSMAASEKEALSDKLQYLTEAVGGTFTIESDYPAWEYKEDSDFREIAFDIYQRCFEKNPRITGYHLGLECGIFYDKIKDIDIIAFGPDITAPDTPKERLYIPSAQRTYELLIEILANC